MKILHVVRRYGPVGGMERYVWEVTRELQQLGHRVEVLCERCHAGKPEVWQLLKMLAASGRIATKHGAIQHS